MSKIDLTPIRADICTFCDHSASRHIVINKKGSEFKLPICIECIERLLDLFKKEIEARTSSNAKAEVFGCVEAKTPNRGPW